MPPDNQLTPDPETGVDPAPAAVADGGNPPHPDPQDNQGEPPKPHGNAGKTPWYMNRINEETNKRLAEAQAREAAEKRARDAEALLERLQRGDKGAADGNNQHQPQNIRHAIPQEQFNAEVQREAARQRLWEDSAVVRNAGLSQFPDFGASLQVLATAGATTDDFVLDVLAVDRSNAHVILDKLAKDPERAATLASMDSRRRIAELTKMTISDGTRPPKSADNQPQNQQPQKPAAVSKAPPPKPSIEPSAPASENDWQDPDKLDKMSEADANAIFSQQWNNKYLRRSA